MRDPFIISSIFLACSFLVVLLFNLKLKSKIIKYSFLVLSLIYLILILVFDNNYIYELLRSLIIYIWYPNYLIFVTIILLTVLILIYTLVKKKMAKIVRIVNYFMFSLAFSCYITFLRLNIDTYSYASLYSKNSLILLRIMTISFLGYLIFNLVYKIWKRGQK